MNETSIAHFKEHFPNENTDKFDKIYFTKASDNDFAFICVQGAMEDFKVFVKGNFESESLEKRVFSLIHKYGGGHHSDRVSIYDETEEDDFYTNTVREELFEKKTNMLPIVTASISSLVLSLIEALGLYFLYSLSGELLPIVALGVFFGSINVWLFFFLKKPYVITKEVVM